MQHRQESPSRKQTMNDAVVAMWRELHALADLATPQRVRRGSGRLAEADRVAAGRGAHEQGQDYREKRGKHIGLQWNE